MNSRYIFFLSIFLIFVFFAIIYGIIKLFVSNNNNNKDPKTVTSTTIGLETKIGSGTEIDSTTTITRNK